MCQQPGTHNKSSIFLHAFTIVCCFCPYWLADCTTETPSGQWHEESHKATVKQFGPDCKCTCFSIHPCMCAVLQLAYDLQGLHIGCGPIVLAALQFEKLHASKLILLQCLCKLFRRHSTCTRVQIVSAVSNEPFITFQKLQCLTNLLSHFKNMLCNGVVQQLSV